MGQQHGTSGFIKYYYSPVRRGTGKKTYILALKGVEEVSTQLPIIPWGPRRIADAT